MTGLEIIRIAAAALSVVPAAAFWLVFRKSIYKSKPVKLGKVSTVVGMIFLYLMCFLMPVAIHQFDALSLCIVLIEMAAFSVIECRRAIRAKRKDILLAFFAILGITPMAYSGLEILFQRIVPDVTEIRHTKRGYSESRYHGWPKGRKVSLGGDYLDNLTSDTLYRVVVVYAIPDENPDNVYTMTDTILPNSFKRLHGRTDYCMRRIPPLKMWVEGKRGRYRRQAGFIVNKPQLDFFIGYDLSPLGLGPNRRVHSIEEQRQSLWQDTAKFRKWEQNIDEYLLDAEMRNIRKNFKKQKHDNRK